MYVHPAKEKNTSLYGQVQDLQSKLQKLRQDHAAVRHTMLSMLYYGYICTRCLLLVQSEGKLEHYTQENDRLQNDMRRISVGTFQLQ